MRELTNTELTDVNGGCLGIIAGTAGITGLVAAASVTVVGGVGGIALAAVAIPVGIAFVITSFMTEQD